MEVLPDRLTLPDRGAHVFTLPVEAAVLTVHEPWRPAIRVIVGRDATVTRSLIDHLISTVH